MLYVTGDIHADIRRLKGRAAKQLKKGDILLVCGDFGFLWDGSPKELRLLDWLGKRPAVRLSGGNALWRAGAPGERELLPAPAR